MRQARATILIALLTCACTSPRPQPLCVIAPALLPMTWRPSTNSSASLKTEPWSPEESADAANAVRTGLRELTDYFAGNPAAIRELGDDAIEPFLDASFGTSSIPGLKVTAREHARRVLAPLLAARLTHGSSPPSCKEFWPLLTLTIYANSLLPSHGADTTKMIGLANGAFHQCGSLQAAIGYDYRQKLPGGNLSHDLFNHFSNDDAWDLVMWSITLTDAQLVPNLELPAEARDLPPAVWRFLQHYPLTGARAYPDGARNKNFYDTAYLATHIAYVPTGYGRHQIYIEDAPELYRFLRENFYPVLERGELDLAAEFVDLFREYGCTEQNDVQLRDGTRYLLALFHQAGNRWMAHREPSEPATINDYDAVHKAWTGIGGVRARVPEPATAGTYGAVIRGWLQPPAARKGEAIFPCLTCGSIRLPHR